MECFLCFIFCSSLNNCKQHCKCNVQFNFGQRIPKVCHKARGPPTASISKENTCYEKKATNK